MLRTDTTVGVCYRGLMARKVLIVDDDPAIRYGLGTLLREQGFDVHAAEHGEAALELLASGLRPGVVLLDLMMPVMDGYAFLTAMRARSDWRRIPVIVISAQRGCRTEDFFGAVFRVVAKPVEYERLPWILNLAFAPREPRSRRAARRDPRTSSHRS